MRIYKKGTRYHLESKYSPKVVEICKGVPGLTWNKKTWECYEDAAVLLASRLREAGMPVELPEAEVGWCSTPNSQLRVYQNVARDFLYQHHKEGCILALEMGLGKTPTTIVHMCRTKTPTLVLCPAFVKGVWRDELAKWWPAAKVIELNGTKPTTLEPFDVVISSYSVIHAHLPALESVRGLVLDEGHILVEEKSKRGKACRTIRSQCDWCVALTGTPLIGAISKSWNLIDTVSPGRVGSYFKFCLRYADAKQKEIKFFTQEPKVVWDFSGKSNVEELQERFKHFVFRKTRAEVAAELPAKTRQIIKVDCGSSDFDVAMLSPAMFRQALLAAADKKMPAVLEAVESRLEAGQKCVVFTYRKATAERIAAEMLAKGYDSAVITGDVEVEKRREIIAKTPEVLCCTIDSCGVGISMVNYSNAIFAELTYEWHKLSQAESRLVRIGQQLPVLLTYIIGEKSVEDRIISTLIAKIDNASELLGDDGSGMAADLKGVEQTEEQAMQSLFESLTLS